MSLIKNRSVIKPMSFSTPPSSPQLPSFSFLKPLEPPKTAVQNPLSGAAAQGQGESTADTISHETAHVSQQSGYVGALPQTGAPEADIPNVQPGLSFNPKSRTPEDPMLTSIKKILEAVRSTLPQASPSVLEGYTSQIKEIIGRAGEALREAAQSSADAEAPIAGEASQAVSQGEASQEASQTQEAEGHQEAQQSQEAEGHQEAEQSQEAEGHQEDQQSQEASSSSEAASHPAGRVDPNTPPLEQETQNLLDIYQKMLEQIRNKNIDNSIKNHLAEQLNSMRTELKELLADLKL